MTLPNPKWQPGFETVLDAAPAVNAGGGLVGLPITAHSFLAGQIVVIAGTTYYNGSFLIVSKTTNQIVITATYVAETFAGTETVIFGRQLILKEDLLDLENAILKVVTDVASAATVTPDMGSSGASIQVNINALAENITIEVPIGTPMDGQELLFRFLDLGVNKNITWASGAGGYIARGATPPATSGAGKYRYAHYKYNANADRFDCLLSTLEA